MKLDKETRELIENLVQACQWMSGSNDFGPGGRGQEGWVRSVQPLLLEANKKLKGL